MTDQALSQTLPASDTRQGAALASIVVASYVAAIALAEATGVFVAATAGVVSHAILAFALLTHAHVAAQAPYRRLLPALALVPLLRILSLAMPIKFVPEIYWYALIGLPLLVGIGLAARAANLSREQIGLRLGAWPAHLLVAASGLPLGLAAAALLPPVAAPSAGGVEIAAGVVMLALAGFAEELLFRGVLMRAVRDLLGRDDLLLSTFLFAVVYLGTRSVEYILFAALVGLFFGWCARKTGAIWGVALAHGLISVGVMYIWAR